MTQDDLDRFAIDAALNETPPGGDDLEVWAQWYDRKAEAARLLLALVERSGGDAADITATQDLIDKASRAAAELRQHITG